MDNPWATTWTAPEWSPAQPAVWDAQWNHDHQSPVSDNVPETTCQEDLQTSWDTAWNTPHASDTQPSDKWEAAREEKEKLNRAVPLELLHSLLRHCQQVSQEIWPAPETNEEDLWRSGFDNHPDIIALLALLLPADSTLPPTVQFSTTATAKAMNEALKLTRHLPATANSPLSCLLASKGSLEWEKSIRAKQDIVPDTIHVGWRVLEKEDRLTTLEETKPKKASGGLLSFWNRRASTIQSAPVETPRERPSSPARSSLEGVKPESYPPSSRAASPPKAPVPSTDTYPTVVATAPASSAVSRFLNRFSRIRGPQHSALALSSDDLEFLSDLVPSASDLLDQDTNDSTLDSFTGASHSSPLSPKLPPPIPPPPKQSILLSHPSSVLGHGTSGSVNATGNTTTQIHTANVPVLAPPLSPKPAASLSRTQSPPLGATSAVVSIVPPIQQALRSSSQPSPRSQPPPQKTSPLLSIPPLLPPPPVSPPQTPRPSTFPSKTPGDSCVMRSTNASSAFHDACESDDEFSAFTSFPPPAPAPLPSSVPYPSQGPPSPPSPPPRRSYERTHYPSSSSASSILSPASQSSLDQLYSTKSSISASLDSFDDFISPSPATRDKNRKRTPSPPPLPVKSQLQHQQPLRLDTSSSRLYHAHTPTQTAFASPTVHTSLMHGAFSSSSVSDTDHRRTQTLVNQAAARGGMLWPNSPDDEPKVMAIPPPPKSLIRQDDLLGDGNTLGGGFERLPAPVSAVGMGSKVLSPPAMDISRVRFGAAGGPGNGLGFDYQLQPSPPPPSLPSMSSFSLGTTAATGILHPAKPKQTGGLSAQDLSFFEGL